MQRKQSYYSGMQAIFSRVIQGILSMRQTEGLVSDMAKGQRHLVCVIVHSYYVTICFRRHHFQKVYPIFSPVSQFLIQQFLVCIRILIFMSMAKLLIVVTQMKVTEQYFHVVLFIMLYEVFLTFKSADEILNCDHSNES